MTHIEYLPLIGEDLPIEAQLAQRLVKFTNYNIQSENPMVKLCGQLLFTGSNSVVCRNRNIVRSVYLQSTYNYYNELMELAELRNCCLRNINNMSDKDLFHVSAIKESIYIWQINACFLKAEVDVMLTYFCVKV